MRDSRVEPAKASLLSFIYSYSIHWPDNYFIYQILFIYLFIYLIYLFIRGVMITSDRALKTSWKELELWNEPLHEKTIGVSDQV